MTPATKAKLSAVMRARNPIASTYDLAQLLAAVRANRLFKDAAAELGITRRALEKRLARLALAGMLPADIAARRHRDAIGQTGPRPRRQVAPRTSPRWTPLGSPVAEVAPFIGPRRVIELPTPTWPAPSEPPADDGFVARRQQLAREAAERSWRERHQEAPIAS